MSCSWLSTFLTATSIRAKQPRIASRAEAPSRPRP
jgi:hypothetical protein